MKDKKKAKVPLVSTVLSGPCNTFELEQRILDCWHVTDDIKDILEEVGNGTISHDELMNSLIGLKSLYEIKFRHTFNEFEKLVAAIHKRKEA